MPDPFRTETFTYGHSAALRLPCAAWAVMPLGGVYEYGFASACVETSLEKGNNGVFGALCWFILFGGVAINLGWLEQRTPLGEGRPALGEDIARSLSLVRRSIGLWLAVVLLKGVPCA